MTGIPVVYPVHNLEFLACPFNLKYYFAISILILLFLDGSLSLSVAEVSSIHGGDGPENVLKNDKSIWHSQGRGADPIPYISLKTDKEEEVFSVKVIDRLGCAACSGRYKDVEVRVASTPSYKGAVSCGFASGDGIKETVHM